VFERILLSPGQPIKDDVVVVTAEVAVTFVPTVVVVICKATPAI
jgi:hypothetical protein